MKWSLLQEVIQSIKQVNNNNNNNNTNSNNNNNNNNNYNNDNNNSIKRSCTNVETYSWLAV